MNSDLTTAQKDYAIYLPAISGFYSTYIGKQQYGEYVPQSRMPAGIPEMEMLNFFNPNKGLFQYQWGLYSAGHAKLNLEQHDPKEAMIRERGKHTTLVADSGGFQIAKGVWEGEWANPSCPRAEKYRSQVLKWLCEISDYSMVLDIPTFAYLDPDASARNGIRSYDDAVNATIYNHEYFIRNSYNDAKFLNVLQGNNHEDSDNWYEIMKQYSDPKKYDKFFRGWAFGGANKADLHLSLKRIVTLIHDGLLQPGMHDWMHFLGTGQIEWAPVLTTIQREVRKYHNPNFTISFDSASPFLSTANGHSYTHAITTAHERWALRTDIAADNKKYSSDTRAYRDAVLSDKINKVFEDSPITEKLLINNICVYAPGELNKIGKEGKTSWDSFSYALLMGHNVWHHINGIQEANRMADTGKFPSILENIHTGLTIRNIIEEIFAEPDYDNRMNLIDHHSKFWTRLPGSSGMGGNEKKVMQSDTMFNCFFDYNDPDLDVDEECFDESKLEELEESV